MDNQNKHQHLLERIKKLDVSIIAEMSPDGMANLTDHFDESLVRNLLYTEKTNSAQRKIIRCIKNNYNLWQEENNMLWGSLMHKSYPKYMDELQMDIECGFVVTEKGSFQENTTRLTISTIPSGAKPVLPIPKSSTPTNQVNDGKGEEETDDKDKEIAELRKELSQVRNDFEQYKKETDQFKEDHTITQEEFDAIFTLNETNEQKDDQPISDDSYHETISQTVETTSSPTCSDEYEELKKRADTLQCLYDAADKRLKRYEAILGTEEELSKEKKFSIAERIIFCSALLGCSLSDDIIQQQMAKMIARFSGDKWGSIRTTISEINGKRVALVEVAKIANQEKDAGARMAVWRKAEKNFQGITNAALNVYNYLHSAVKGGTVRAKPHQCKQAMENIDHAYYLTERKLITPTDTQPQGDDFLISPDEI